MKADEKRQQQEEEQKSGKSRPHGSHCDQQASERRGRKPSHEKIDQANVHELVLPEGFNRSQSTPSIDQPVWRIRDGKAILVVYEIYRDPNGEQGSIDGVKDHLTAVSTLLGERRPRAACVSTIHTKTD